MDRATLADYLLSPSHPVGRFKARFFNRLGFRADAWEELEHDLREQHARADAEAGEHEAFTDIGLRCYPCFNEEVAARMGADFDNTPLQPVAVADANGVNRTFEFRSMLAATGHVLSAREVLPAEREGYEFSVLGDFEARVWDLFEIL